LSESKFRIPHVAAATLLLGGAACGDDGGGTPGGSTSGVNTSSSRIRSVAASLCKQTKQCEPDDFYSNYDDVADCTQQLVDDFPLAGESGDDVKNCQDALLDFYACLAQLSCDTTDAQAMAKCGDFYTSYDTLCGPLVDSYAYDGVYSGGNSPLRSKRRFRIPR